MPHRFAVGQLVTYESITTADRFIPFEITGYRPQQDGEHRYRIKRHLEEFERVAFESELKKVPAQH